MHKVYLSIPMTGREDTIYQRCQEAKKQVQRIEGYEDSIFVEPIGIEMYKDGANLQYASSKTWGQSMADNLVHLVDDGCTDIYMSQYWEDSKGCRVEEAISKILGINILYS